MRTYAAAKLRNTNPKTDWDVIYKDENEEVWYIFINHVDKEKAMTITDAMNIST